MVGTERKREGGREVGAEELFQRQPAGGAASAIAPGGPAGGDVSIDCRSGGVAVALADFLFRVLPAPVRLIVPNIPTVIFSEAQLPIAASAAGPGPRRRRRDSVRRNRLGSSQPSRAR